MKRQISFAEAESHGKKRVTRRQRFLAEMESVVPWQRLIAAVEPYYPKGHRGRPPIGLERMLRIYFLQQWYGLSDEALEDALYDSMAMRAFAGIDLAVEAVPDATTLLKFRRMLVEHELTRKLFDEIGIMLCERGLMMKEGTIVDATIIEAPPSTKNKQKGRDPEMHQTKKGNAWHFGMKAHLGVDAASGLVAWWAPRRTRQMCRRRMPCCMATKSTRLAMRATQAWRSATRCKASPLSGKWPSSAARSRRCATAPSRTC
jgi:IS5 family transposase